MRSYIKIYQVLCKLTWVNAFKTYLNVIIMHVKKLSNLKF